MNGMIQLIGRIMLALIFILAGISKMMDPAGTSGYMQSMGVPTLFLWPTILLEIFGGIALIVGYRTAIAAVALALFSIVAAVLFHSDFGDKIQMILFMKNIAMAGGLLLLATSGVTSYSFDSKKKNASFFSTRR
ncbi:MAG: DoxX family protein [Methylophilaceae bacterium]